MKKIVRILATSAAILGTLSGNDSLAMQEKIYRNLIQMVANREDVVEAVRPFLTGVNDPKYVPFLKTFQRYQLGVLHRNGILGNEVMSALGENLREVRTSEIDRILAADNVSEFQGFIQKRGIDILDGFGTMVTVPFREVEAMKFPLIQYCLLKKAIKCFKYLLLNGANPCQPTEEANPMRILNDTGHFPIEIHRYWWDCMAMAIYMNQSDVIEILKAQGIEQWSRIGHVDAAVLSYRNDAIAGVVQNWKSFGQWHMMLTLLWSAAKYNNVEAMELIPVMNVINANMSNNPRDQEIKFIDTRDRSGMTPLQYAILNDSLEVFHILLSRGADVNIEDRVHERTPLHWAVLYNRLEMIKVLLRKGANINAMDNQDCAPLYYALLNNNRAVIAVLLGHGVDNRDGLEGMTLLDLGADDDPERIISVLLKQKRES